MLPVKGQERGGEGYISSVKTVGFIWIVHVKRSVFLPQVKVQDDANLRLKSLDADQHMGPEELLLLDAAPDMSSKLKKAFCEPQKTDFCPPLTLVEQVRPFFAYD